MSAIDRRDVDQERLASLETELAEMRQQMAELRAQLRSDGADRPLAVPPRAAVAPVADGAGAVDLALRSVSRRGLIAGAAGAVAAGAAVVVGSATPAAANDQGESLTLGDFTNSCTTTTGLHATNVDPVLMITSYGNDGSNAAQFYVHDATGTGAVTHHETAGQGPAAEFINSNANSTAATVDVQTGGKGSAGAFVVTNTASNASGLSTFHQGTGNALQAVSAASGRAAFFGGNASVEAVFVAMTGSGSAVVVNSTSTSTTNPAVSVQTTAPGPAIRARGPVTNLSLTGRTTVGAPTADTAAHTAGDLVEDSAGTLWVCVTSGTPGKWRKVAGPATAGAFHVLPAPARIYDSRPGGAPTSVGPKTPLPAGGTRVFDCSVNDSGVPLGATAVSLTILLVNATNGNGNFTVWANGVAKPVANTMVWGAGSGRWTASTITAIDAAAKIQVSASAATDLVLDVVGYYR